MVGDINDHKVSALGEVWKQGQKGMDVIILMAVLGVAIRYCQIERIRI